MLALLITVLIVVMLVTRVLLVAVVLLVVMVVLIRVAENIFVSGIQIFLRPKCLTNCGIAFS